MKKSTLRKLCLFLNFMMIMPFAVFFVAAIFAGVNPFFTALMLFLLILPSANFFHIYYKKKKSFLLNSANLIAGVFCVILMVYGFLDPNDTSPDILKIIVTMIFLIFSINHAYISGEEKFWLNSYE